MANLLWFTTNPDHYKTVEEHIYSQMIQVPKLLVKKAKVSARVFINGGGKQMKLIVFDDSSFKNRKSKRGVIVLLTDGESECREKASSLLRQYVENYNQMFHVKTC